MSRRVRRVSLDLEDAGLLYELASAHARRRGRERDPVEPKVVRALERVRVACYAQAQGDYEREGAA